MQMLWPCRGSKLAVQAANANHLMKACFVRGQREPLRMHCGTQGA
jgi:hypothetical protein